MYLHEFVFPNRESEYSYRFTIKRTCYNSFYPFQILSRNDFEHLSLEPLTILYGGNGSGKTTALNVIAQKLELDREAVYNRTNFFDDYVMMCQAKSVDVIPRGSRIITSDDVFDYMLNVRNLNEGIHEKRSDLFKEYLGAKNNKFQFKTMDDYDALKKMNQARRFTQSKYVRENINDNVRELSNGESAFKYFTERITENALYLLDEPENSLSPKLQVDLVKYIEDASRFFGCQFIISTHSPFILAMKGAKIYDLDSEPVQVKQWTQLPNVRAFYDFFISHKDEF